MEDLMILIIILIGLFLGSKIYKYFLRPWLLEKTTKDIEINPKWITDKLRKEYYGFSDIDFILVDATFGWLPRVRLSKDNKLQVLLPEDFSTKDVDKLAQVTLVAKIKWKYNLWFPDKPTFWLSILCYMLDGGEINQDATSWKESKRQEKC